MSNDIAIDPGLVERRILELATHGAHSGTGVWRTVYSPEWVAATELYASWCAEAGFLVRRDAVGNVWGRLDGTEGGKAIVSGSHIDTQRPGGRYDGALGAIAALVAIDALQKTVRPAAPPARSAGALRGGRQPLSDRAILGLAGDHRRHRAGRPGDDGEP